MKEEINGLLKKGYDWKNSVLGETLGYDQWQLFFEKGKPQTEVIKRWQFAEHAYARRQLTWFKKEKRINWLEITRKDYQEKAKKLVGQWL